MCHTLFDILVVAERLLKACVHVCHVVKAVGVSLKPFKSQRINHGRIVKVEQLHIAELIHTLINDVDIGIFLAVLTYKFLHNYLGAYGSFLLYGIWQLVLLHSQCGGYGRKITVMTYEECEFTVGRTELVIHILDKGVSYIGSHDRSGEEHILVGVLHMGYLCG